MLKWEKKLANKNEEIEKWKKNLSFEIQTLTRMVIPLSQQYEEKENNRVNISFYVEI